MNPQDRPKHTFVVVDDDEFVRDSVARGLERHFKDTDIHAFDNPTFAVAAIKRLLQQGKRIDLVFTDFDMGEENGRVVVEACLGAGVPVILMSRGSDSEEFLETKKLVGANFLAKPASSSTVGPFAEKVLARAHV